MRGEYTAPETPPPAGPELPPHARRIPYRLVLQQCRLGTTSACAENTLMVSGTGSGTGNYLRMRGEYVLPSWNVITEEELPPHARRILRWRTCPRSRPGTTSACAENTAATLAISRLAGNYLRMRGEYPLLGPAGPRSGELPPHARRIPPA